MNSRPLHCERSALPTELPPPTVENKDAEQLRCIRPVSPNILGSLVFVSSPCPKISASELRCCAPSECAAKSPSVPVEKQRSGFRKSTFRFVGSRFAMGFAECCGSWKVFSRLSLSSTFSTCAKNKAGLMRPALKVFVMYRWRPLLGNVECESDGSEFCTCRLAFRSGSHEVLQILGRPVDFYVVMTSKSDAQAFQP